MKKPIKPEANIYIDGANMFYAQQKMGWFIDYRKIVDYLKKDYRIVKMNFYIGVKANDQKAQKFNRRLENYGFKIIAKPLKKIHLSKNKYIYKANFDVEIAVDLIQDSNNFQTAILFSGDSDFEYVIKRLKQKDKNVIICSSRSALARELMQVASKVILLGNIRKEIEYQ